MGPNLIGLLSLREEEETPEHTTGRWPSASQGGRTREKPHPPTPQPWACSLQNCEKYISLFQLPRLWFFVTVIFVMVILASKAP